LDRADPHLAIARLKERLADVANISKTPEPDVTILTFNPFGPVLAVRPYCHNDHYWQVYFDANMVIRQVLGDTAFPGPAYPLAVAEARKVAVAGQA
jgi:small conductance mechanosensitive channel